MDHIIVYSCGVGNDISFDLEILNKWEDTKILAFDPTPISIEWISRQNDIPKNYKFFPIGIGSKNRMEKMYFPKNHAVSYTAVDYDVETVDEIVVEMKTIESIAEENGHRYIDILKMDIEGSEFSVINSLGFEKLTFGQILVEFHERFIKDGKSALKHSIK